MRNMSFALTTEQIRNRTKTVTRRKGWRYLKPGDLLRAVVKSQGLKKGEKVEELAVLRVTRAHDECLTALLDDLDYGFKECQREGFGNHPDLQSPDRFVEWFCFTHDCEPTDFVTRVEFEYV